LFVCFVAIDCGCVVPQPTVNAGGVGGCRLCMSICLISSLLAAFFGRAFKEVWVSAAPSVSDESPEKYIMRYYCRASKAFY